MLTIDRLFNEPHIVGAVINRVLQTRKDAIYWQEYLSFRRTSTRVFKDYIGTVTGVMAGSINSRYGEKPIRERREMGYGYGEVAYLGDLYQISVDRLSELQDLVDKFNAMRPDEQQNALQQIIDFIYDDYRQVLLAAHKRMDMVFGELIMTGGCTVKNKDNRVDSNTPDVLAIKLPFKIIAPQSSDVNVDSQLKFISYLKEQLEELEPDFGAFQRMIMSRRTFNKYIVGSSEFGEKFRTAFGTNQFYLNPTLITSELASQVFQGIGLPAIEIKSDYVKDQNGKNVQVYADNHITLLPDTQVGFMRFHTPYEMTDPVPGRNYTPADGDMLISSVRDGNGRYLEYTAEWIPQISNPDQIASFDLSNLAS